MNLFIMQVLSNITLTCNMEHNVVGVLIKHFIKKKKITVRVQFWSSNTNNDHFFREREKKSLPEKSYSALNCSLNIITIRTVDSKAPKIVQIYVSWTDFSSSLGTKCSLAHPRAGTTSPPLRSETTSYNPVINTSTEGLIQLQRCQRTINSTKTSL